MEHSALFKSPIEFLQNHCITYTLHTLFNKHLKDKNDTIDLKKKKKKVFDLFWFEGLY